MVSTNKYPRFNERKATEAAILLLKMAGGRMRYIRLVKLLYLIDRQAFYKLGRSITNDTYCSMPKGMVPSRVYDLVKGKANQAEGVWKRNIKTPVSRHYAELRESPEQLKVLSEAEKEIVRAVSMEHIDRDDFELADYTKGPEYIDVGELNLKVCETPVERILEKAFKYNQEEIEKIKESLAEEADIEAFFGG